MGRKRAANEMKMPKEEVLTEVKREKRDVSPVSDEEEEYYEEVDITEAEETKFENGSTTYEPDELRVLVESFLNYMANQSHIPSVHNMEKTLTDWVESRPDDLIDAGAFRADFRKYLKTGLIIRNLQLNDAAAVVMSYLGSEKALNDFKEFPSKTPSKVQEYIKRKNLTFKMAELGKAYQMMRDDKSGLVEQISEEINATNLNSLSDLRKFLVDHPNLTKTQRTAIENKIKRTEKANEPKRERNGANGATPRKKSKKAPETAYSIWCRTMTDKYRDLSKGEREKKLKKKFAKLPEGQLQLLESLALVH